jgi:hypothetical protein
LADAIDATTVSLPAGTGGIRNAQGVPLVPGKTPVALAEQTEIAGAPSTVTTIEAFAGNPEPDAFTIVPTVPLVGERTKVGDPPLASRA